MQAIDYKKLMREERKRLRNKKKTEETKENDVNTHRREKETRFDTAVNRNNIDWHYDSGLLAFRKISLRSICESPRSICYSSTALGEQVKQDRDNANKKESLSPEVALTNWLQRLPSGDSGLGEWKTMAFGKRRVCMFGGETEVGNKASPSLPAPLEEMARELVKQRIFPSSSPPNHVLLNEYQPGQGILPHTDGPLYQDCTATLSLGSDVVIEFSKRLSSDEIGKAKTVSVMNSVSNDCNETRKHNDNHPSDDKEHTSDDKPTESIDDELLTVLLESGSLLVFRGEAYMDYCHGIEMDAWQDVTTDKCLNAPSGRIVPRGLRYSLTFRHKKAKEME